MMHKTQQIVGVLSASIDKLVEACAAEGMPVLIAIGVVDEDGDAAQAIWSFNGPKDPTTILQPVIKRQGLAMIVLSEPGFDECDGVAGFRKASGDEAVAASVLQSTRSRKPSKAEDFDA